MNRSVLIKRLAELHLLLRVKDVALAVTLILDSMAETLLRGERIEVRGFGSFSTKYSAPRIGRNPKTGVAVEVPAKYILHFKPGTELQRRVNK